MSTEIDFTLPQLKSKLYRYIIDELDVTWSFFKNQHYNRNSFQPETMSYLEVLLGDFQLAHDNSSVFHRIDVSGADRPNHIDAHNSKFTKAIAGTITSQEYVFRYEGNAQTGQFQMVDHPTNMGTFNFAKASSAAGVPHMMVDVIPWILWGSAENDKVMTPEERLHKTLGGIPGKVTEKIDTFGNQLQATFDWFPFDKKRGTAGDDKLLGTNKEERFFGSGGIDAVDYSNVTYDRDEFGRGVVASLLTRKGYEGWAKGDTYKDVENLIGSDWGDILLGNNGANILFGGDGKDILQGMKGADFLDGGSGENTINAGAGNDTIVIRDAKTLVDGDWGEDRVISHLDRLYVGNDKQYYDVEIFELYDSDTTLARHIVGSDQKEVLTGNRHSNDLRGNGGNDTIIGGAGDDGLEGGQGNDVYIFETGWGKDIVREEKGWDAISFLDHALDDLRLERLVQGTSLKIYSKTTDDVLTLWNHFSYQTDLGFERLLTSDATVKLNRGLPLTGTDGKNSYSGTNYADTIDLKNGDDWVYANGGRDTIIGGEGNDTLWGGNGNDTFIFKPGFGQDIVWEAGAYLNEIDSGGDTIEFQGYGFSQVRREVEFDGDVILHAGGDTIYIPRQTFNQGVGNLVEYVSFDGSSKMSIDALLPYDELAYSVSGFT